MNRAERRRQKWPFGECGVSAEGVRALTIRQPWASLIAAGVKTIETRSWSTDWRGRLLIHAGRQWAKGWLGWMPEGDDRLNLIDSAGGCSHEDVNGSGYYRPWAKSLPLGAVVAVADLTDVVPMNAWRDEPRGSAGWGYAVLNAAGQFNGPCVWLHENDCLAPRFGEWQTDVSDQLPLGDFTPGRYAWLLDNVRPIDPVPAKGKQGLWTPDESLVPAGLSEGGERA